MKPPFLKALRILKMIEPEEGETRKGALSGPRVEASRNFWEGSGLKIDSSSTDVVWGHGSECFDPALVKVFI
jgi:WD repeat-containing protein 24